MSWIRVFFVMMVGLGSVAMGQAAVEPTSQNRDMGHPAKRAMTFQDLMAMKRVSDPQVSPGGKWVLFSVTDVSLAGNTKVNHLWVVPLQPTSENPDMGHPVVERQITFSTGESFGRFSPDGQFVSYTGAPMKDDPYSRITIATWDEKTGTIGMGRTLQAVSGDADGAVWSPDNKRFLFTTQVYPECSDKAKWSEEDACDKAKDEAADKSPVKAQLFTGLLYRHWNAFTGQKRTHVIVADFSLAGPNPRDLTPKSVVGDAETPTFSLGGPLGYAWAPDGKEIAYVTNLDTVPAASTNNDVFTLRLDEAGARPVKVSTSLGSDDGPAYSPDGRWLAFRSQARAGYESDRFRLMVFDRQAKTIRELMPKFDRWVDEFVWAGDSQALYFASGVSGSEQVFSIGLSGNELNLRTFVDSRGEWGEFAELNISHDGTFLVSSRSTVANPTELFLTSFVVDRDLNIDTVDAVGADGQAHKPEAGTYESAEYGIYKTTQLTRINRDALGAFKIYGGGDASSPFRVYDVGKHEGQPMESFTFLGDEGTKVQGFVVKPPNFDPKKKYPVKFLIHGGPQGAWGDAWSYRWNPELMAASGYVVVMVNPRGSTGYGQAFIDGVNGDWGGKAYVDLMKGLDAAEMQFPFIDKDRECALGASYGGFMANWMLTHTNRFKCIVTHDGMYNPAAAYGDTEEMWFNEWEFRRAGEKEPGQPWRYASLPADQDPFRKWSPMLSIQNAKTPTLVIHSQKDYRLDVSEGFQLFTALQRLGVPSEMLYFPDEGHWVTKPQNAELWNKTVSDWCDKWTHTNAYAGVK
ncbi:S9 family peptidase [Granulicella tundricola]|uniref:Peptidase S9, prolyl oligopeptidase active site region n=1 Tax=Granulicella tundricola (strain ATCC BAA-1859 / DSM 23138 / MP5ACTX9) TaxID=1198114 RepID=E8WYL1_GRATM|nr:S9 family peptidase [Granulicella tundricola]ADW67609.1 peptidase S9, prolyl oligopeptidase active site region [Granulicella tundricola MP5ACTX9]